MHPKATASIKMLLSLDITKTEFENEHPDEFKFLRQMPLLQRLLMSNCFPENNCTVLDSIPAMPDILHVELASIGLISLVGIKEKFPKVGYLDLRGNRIYSTDTVEQIKLLPKLHTLLLHKNPITMNVNLKDMLMEAAPQLEILDAEKIRPTG